MDKITNFFKIVWKFLNSKIFLYLVLILIGAFLFNMYTNNEDLKLKNIKSEQNISALSDSLTTYITKYNRLNSTIPGFLSTEKELKDLNRSLYDEIKKQNGNVLSLNRTVLRLKKDSTDLSNRITSILGAPYQLNDSTYSMNWLFIDNEYGDKFGGVTTVGLNIKDRTLLFNNANIDSKFLFNSIELKHISSKLTSQEINIDLIFGQKIVDDKLMIFAETNRKDINFTNMDGFFIDPNNNDYIKSLIKRRQWFPGTFSIGVGATAGYDILHARPALTIGITGQYTIFQW
ncbi:MAG: hypothetical protein WDA02_04925 [Saccharofermentanales bacterium]